ncbi:hypothetical protein FOZ63_019231, partial [Perkinsus olseni]
LLQVDDSVMEAITRGAVSFEPAIVHEAVDLPYGPFDWGLVMNVLSLVSENSSSRADELSSLLRNIGAKIRKGVVLFAWKDLVNYADIEEVGARFIDAKIDSVASLRLEGLIRRVNEGSPGLPSIGV